MKDYICQYLKTIESKYTVTILYACGTGSRQYGSSTLYSDYDIRFIFVRSIKDYLKLNKEREVITEQLPRLDFHGWDVYKAFELFHKSNPSLYEWLFSNIIYIEAEEIIPELRNILKDSISLNKLCHHYISMAENNLATLQSKQLVGHQYVKNALQAIRGLLMAHSITKDNKLPPIQLNTLIRLYSYSQEVMSLFDKVLTCKQYSVPLAETDREMLLNVLLNGIENVKGNINETKTAKINVEALNNLLWKIFQV